jgi:hypothetical protein
MARNFPRPQALRQRDGSASQRRVSLHFSLFEYCDQQASERWIGSDVYDEWVVLGLF